MKSFPLLKILILKVIYEQKTTQNAANQQYLSDINRV